MQLLISPSKTCKITAWEGGEHGIRFRVGRKGVFDATAPSNHPVLAHIRRIFGVDYWGLTRLKYETAWNSIHLSPPEDVKPYNPKSPHGRGTKSALERLLDAEGREWRGLLSRQELHNIASSLGTELHLESTNDED